MLTDASGVWFDWSWVEGVPRRTPSRRARDRGADRRAAQTVSSTTYDSEHNDNTLITSHEPVKQGPP